MTRFLITLATLLVALYLLLCAGLYLFQRQLLYVPQPRTLDAPGSTLELTRPEGPLQVTVQGGHVVRVQGDAAHPPTHGALCTKVSRYAERIYHPDRVLQPLRRVGPKGAGRFEPIGWDEALDTVAARL